MVDGMHETEAAAAGVAVSPEPVGGGGVGAGERYGRTVVACGTAYGMGGLGQRFAEVVTDASGATDELVYYAGSFPAGDARGRLVADRWVRPLTRYTPIRFSRGRTNYVVADRFDRKVAGMLEGPIDRFIGFVGQCERSLARARELGARRLDVIAANSHVDNVLARHAEALHRLPIEESWLNEKLAGKTRAEYAQADAIHVASEYVAESLTERGVPGEKIVRVRTDVDARFTPGEGERADDGVFRVVYIGQVSVVKGVPLLVEAFQRARLGEAELTLVGGVGTRGMRRYMEGAMSADPRVRLAPGDPLPALREADVCVHPTWEDGFGRAPLEAMRAGVPAVVTEDTGMKELITEGHDGWVIPTGSVDAIVARLEALAEGKR